MTTTSPPHPDRVLRLLGEVPGYLKQRYGESVARSTVFLWAKTGRHGVILRTTFKSPLSATRYTTWEWVREFLAKSK